MASGGRSLIRGGSQYGLIREVASGGRYIIREVLHCLITYYIFSKAFIRLSFAPSFIFYNKKDNQIMSCFVLFLLVDHLC